MRYIIPATPTIFCYVLFQKSFCGVCLVLFGVFLDIYIIMYVLIVSNTGHEQYGVVQGGIGFIILLCSNLIRRIVGSICRGFSHVQLLYHGLL